MTAINIGSGRFRIPGWINIDVSRRHMPDVIADARRLPFRDASVDRIYAGHVLEHIEWWQIALNEFRRVLKRGGILYIVVPDVTAAVRSPDYRLQADILAGSEPETTHDLHRTVWSRETLAATLTLFGFHVTDHSIPEFAVSRAPWQAAATAIAARNPHPTISASIHNIKSITGFLP